MRSTNLQIHFADRTELAVATRRPSDGIALESTRMANQLRSAPFFAALFGVETRSRRLQPKG
jgi:hypothetical protein